MNFFQERRNSKEKDKSVNSIDIEGRPDLMSPEFKKRLASLTRYLAKHLQLKKLPSSLKLVNSKQNADNPYGLTGHYDHTTKKITVYITDRHETDILRTFSHEMIHHWQNERGVLHPEDDGFNIQGNNDAIPHYAQNNPWLRKREMEAYLFGCILFRDWQDEQRMGPPSQHPFLPRPYD
jgi:hypothetical protein